jgi:sugar lactone lactonase YvrE
MTTPGVRGRTFTARQAFTALAVLLTVVLVGLLVYLYWFLGRSEALPGVAGEPIAGVQRVWEVYGPGEGESPRFAGPMGVAVGTDDRIYVTDSGNNRVCVFDVRGRFQFEFGGFGVAKPSPGSPATYDPGELNYPVGIDVDEEGNVYVASFYNDSIEVYDADGTPLRRFPDPGTVVGRGGSGYGGRGIAVTDVAVRDGHVYATDTYQVLVFTLDGELVDQWGKPGTGPGDLDHPNGIAVSEDGRAVYVSDSNHARVTAFSVDGTVLWQVGALPEGTSAESGAELQLPRGIEVMPDGSLLVVDAFGFDLVRISADGEVLARYGERGVECGQWNFANDASAVRGFVLVADKGNGRIQLVRLID